MLNTLRLLAVTTAVALIAGAALAQRPRPTTPVQNPADQSTPEGMNPILPAPAPVTVNAKYEGGVFGYTRKMNGTLNFDDENKRLLFRDKKGKEVLFVPYGAINGAFNDIKKVQPSAGTVT